MKNVAVAVCNFWWFAKFVGNVVYGGFRYSFSWLLWPFVCRCVFKFFYFNVFVM